MDDKIKRDNIEFIKHTKQKKQNGLSLEGLTLFIEDCFSL